MVFLRPRHHGGPRLVGSSARPAWRRSHTSARGTGTSSTSKPSRTLPPLISSTVTLSRRSKPPEPPMITDSLLLLDKTSMVEPPFSGLIVCCVAANLDYHGRDVIELWRILREGANGVVEVGHDSGGWIVPVDADDVHDPAPVESGAVGRRCLDHAVAKQNHELAGFERNCRGRREILVRADAERYACARQAQADLARCI